MITDKVETVAHRFDLVSLGECLVELRREAPGQYSQSFAGDVFNTLYYASRLGLRTGFISQFGSDHFTEGLIELCKQEGIDTSICKTHHFLPNGIYMIRTDDAGQPSFSFWRRGSAATRTLSNTSLAVLSDYILSSKTFLFSAIGLAVFIDTEKLFMLLNTIKGKVQIYFDMNVRPSLWDDVADLRQYVERLAEYVDVLFVSSTDDMHVFGERTASEAIGWYRSAGYRAVVYRDGANPTRGWTAEAGLVEVPAIQNVTVVDATGAGDAFNAGFIFASEKSFAEAIRVGNICGALAVGERGGQAKTFGGGGVERQF